MPNRTGYLYDDVFLEHELDSGHPESPLRLAALHAVISESGLLNKLIPLRPLTNDNFIIEQITKQLHKLIDVIKVSEAERQ